MVSNLYVVCKGTSQDKAYQTVKKLSLYIYSLMGFHVRIGIKCPPLYLQVLTSTFQLLSCFIVSFLIGEEGK